MSFTILVNNTTGLTQGPFTDNPPIPDGWSSRQLSDAEKALFDNRSDDDLVILSNNELVIATLDQKLPLLPLRTALRAIFASVDDPDKIASVWPIKLSLETAYSAGQPLTVIRALLENSDVGDDSQLLAAKAAMLALPQWNQ